MESTNSYQVEDQVEETEKMLEEKKKDWELNHLQSLKEAEERKHAEEEDDMLFTYVRDETYNQVKKNKTTPNTKGGSGGGGRKGGGSSGSGGSVKLSLTTTDDISDKKQNNNTKDKQNLHVNMKPLLLKLSDDKIAQIKTKAHETIQAKSEAIKSPLSTPGRKPAVKKIRDMTETSSSDKKTDKHTLTSPTIVQKSTPGRKPREKRSALLTGTRNRSNKHTPTDTDVTLVKNTTPKSQKAIKLKDFISTASSPCSSTDSSLSNGVSAAKSITVSSSKKLSLSKSLLKNTTTISSAASSPNSLGSPDSLSGDIRRSSRTPRPKVMDDEWVVFN